MLVFSVSVQRMYRAPSVKVCDSINRDGTPVPDPRPAPEPECNGGEPNKAGKLRDVDAHQVSGLGFIGFGGGLQWAIIKNFGIQLEVKATFIVPIFAFALSPPTNISRCDAVVPGGGGAACGPREPPLALRPRPKPQPPGRLPAPPDPTTVSASFPREVEWCTLGARLLLWCWLRFA